MYSCKLVKLVYTAMQLILNTLVALVSKLPPDSFLPCSELSGQAPKKMVGTVPAQGTLVRLRTKTSSDSLNAEYVTPPRTTKRSNSESDASKPFTFLV